MVIGKKKNHLSTKLVFTLLMVTLTTILVISVKNRDYLGMFVRVLYVVLLKLHGSV